MRFKVISFLLLISCSPSKKSDSTATDPDASGDKTTGSIEKLMPQLDEIIAPDARLEILAEGFDWTEGPLWVENGQFLLFSDIPPNRVHKWKDGEGVSIYLEPSGYTGEKPRGGEPGANGLLLNGESQLVLCQHGDRRMAIMDAPLEAPESQFVTLVDQYQGKRFNSPNDAAFHSNGSLYFTDPPYGLEGRMEDPKKEIPFQGVYRLDPSGEVMLLTNEITRPNGIAFSPDEKTLYVASSDADKAIWMAYDVQQDGAITNGRIFYDATDRVPDEKGLPDGLKVNREGIIFATGPGGVYVFDPQAQLLGMIRTGQATANCALDANEKTLYITADMYLMRVKLI